MSDVRYYLFEIFRQEDCRKGDSGASSCGTGNTIRAISEEDYVFLCYKERFGESAFAGALDSIQYLADQVIEVKEDPRIDPSNRRFYDLVLKVKEDIENDPVFYEPLAEPALKWMQEDLTSFYNSLNIKVLEQTGGMMSDLKMSNGLVLKLLEKLYHPDDFEPSRLYSYLNQFVIGQDRAKRILSTTIYGHMKRIKYLNERFTPDCVLLVGPSGCGKTELARHLVEILDIPCVFTDVSSMGGSQYAGGKKREDILRELYHNAGYNLEKAETGVVFMDEFDKLLVPSISSTGLDTHGEVQGQLLTMIEGAKLMINIPGRGEIEFDTSRVLFIMAGAFQGIGEYIKESESSRQSDTGNIGFGARLLKDIDTSYTSANINQDVLMRFGMKKELTGRIGHIAVVNQLSREEMKRILTEPKNSILERYAREIKLYCGGNLTMDTGTLEKIVDMAMGYEVGARGLSIVLRKLMADILYEAPGRQRIKMVNVSIEDGKAKAEWIGE